METGEDRSQLRPDTSLTPPPKHCTDRELLEFLLSAELGRLEVALNIEKTRKTVFPETSVVIRDILKLHQGLRLLDDHAAGKAAKEPSLLDDLLLSE